MFLSIAVIMPNLVALRMWQKQDSIEGLSLGLRECMADPYKHISPHVRYFISFISSISTHKEAEKLYTTIFMMSTLVVLVLMCGCT